VGGFEIVEHTADVGVVAHGDTLEETFEQATRGLAAIMGAWSPGDGERIEIDLRARDVEGVLIDWLNEVLYVQDVRDAVVRDVGVTSIEGGHITGWIVVGPREASLEGTPVKAATYHGLYVREDADGWSARAYVDV